MSSAKAPASKPEFSPLSLVRMLWKHIVMIIVTAIVGAGATFAIVRELPDIYRSEALILVDSQKIPERYVSSTVNTEVQDRLATISQEILSATRLQKIIDEFGLYRDERKKLVQEEIIERMRKDINIDLEKGWSGDRPGAFRIGYEGTNPKLVTEVANELASLFIEENLRTRERQAQGTADFIDSQLQEAKKTLDQLEAKVSAYKLAHNGDLPEQQGALNSRLASLQIELQGNQDAISRAQQNKVLLEGTLSMSETAINGINNSQAAAAAGHAPDASAAKNLPAETNLQYLQSQYDDLSKQYQPTYPRMVALKHEIEREKLIQDQQRARMDSIKSQITLADREIQQRTKERDGILKAISELQARIEQLPVREQEMAELTRDYEESKSNYKSLLDKKLAAAMATDMERRQQGERFTLLDPPRVPERPISPKTHQIELGCVISLALGFALAVGAESRKNAVLGEWELPDDIPVLGRVPMIEVPHRSHRNKRNQDKRNGWKWVIVSSAVVLGVVTCAAGAYFYWGRF
jgi:polysaccharide biosynthesis transport protein